ncbi:helix-turn-helix transcriptional regulator [Actinospica durhamensis]|uniref:Helix-turn-helix transcriptional regulator n=1 Tax=Actinospica durhamensis TaxID=1508375 RepID=A0A941ET76_9ACTN|nr:AraC family transcriptional regulator [Actinospica durhamensis]MBR7836601.1 helix-turn-helix transcriptional regulator [Actinospica durhamensis]
MAVIIDTDLQKAGRRAEALRSLIAQTSAPHDVRFTDPDDQVNARIEAWELGPDVTLIQYRGSGAVHTRDERHLRQVGPDRVALLVHQGRSGSLAQHPQGRSPRPGGLYATAVNSRYAYTRNGSGTVHVMLIERDRLGVSVESVQDSAARLALSPLYDLMRDHLQTLCRDVEEIDSSGQGAAVGFSTAELARSLLMTSRERPAREAVENYLLERIVRHIHEHCLDPQITPERIARDHAISRRLLYKIWSGQPRSIVATIMDLRLAAAERQLRSSKNISIAALAAHCGFLDAAHFSRRFTQSYGTPPSQWRAALLENALG